MKNEYDCKIIFYFSKNDGSPDGGGFINVEAAGIYLRNEELAFFKNEEDEARYLGSIGASRLLVNYEGEDFSLTVVDVAKKRVCFKIAKNANYFKFESAMKAYESKMNTQKLSSELPTNSTVKSTKLKV